MSGKKQRFWKLQALASRQITPLRIPGSAPYNFCGTLKSTRWISPKQLESSAHENPFPNHLITQLWSSTIESVKIPTTGFAKPRLRDDADHIQNTGTLVCIPAAPSASPGAQSHNRHPGAERPRGTPPLSEAQVLQPLSPVSPCRPLGLSTCSPCWKHPASSGAEVLPVSAQHLCPGHRTGDTVILKERERELWT